MMFAAQPLRTPGPGLQSRLRVDLLPYLLFLPALLTIGAILFYPVLQAIVISLRSYYLPNVATVGTPFCGLANYRAISEASEFWHALLFNGIYTVGSVAGLYAVSLAVALLLNHDFRGRGLFRGLAVVPWAVPYVVAALTWIWIFDIQFGVLNSVLLRIGVIEKAIPWLLSPNWAKFSVILSTIWKQFPFAAIMLLAGLQSIPRSLYEAAGVDGAGPVDRFRFVTMPGLHNVSLLVILLSGIQVFKLFTVIYLLTGGGPGRATETLVVQTYLEAFSTFDMGRASAIGVVTLVLTLIFSVVLIRLGYREEIRG
jgi:multiple sugar transport system permease protein